MNTHQNFDLLTQVKWFVYFTLDMVYKVKAVFIVFLDRTTHILGNLAYQFNLATKNNISIFTKR